MNSLDQQQGKTRKIKKVNKRKKKKKSIFKNSKTLSLLNIEKKPLSDHIGLCPLTNTQDF